MLPHLKTHTMERENGLLRERHPLTRTQAPWLVGEYTYTHITYTLINVIFDKNFKKTKCNTAINVIV